MQNKLQELLLVLVKRLFMNLQNVVRKLPWVPGIWMNYTKSKQI